nr:MAG TPA: hypothetical protein [Caudoviricetes sp.]
MGSTTSNGSKDKKGGVSGGTFIVVDKKNCTRVFQYLV